MRLMLSEAVLMSTLQSRSTRRGKETVEGTAQLRAHTSHIYLVFTLWLAALRDIRM